MLKHKFNRICNLDNINSDKSKLPFLDNWPKSDDFYPNKQIGCIVVHNSNTRYFCDLLKHDDEKDNYQRLVDHIAYNMDSGYLGGTLKKDGKGRKYKYFERYFNFFGCQWKILYSVYFNPQIISKSSVVYHRKEVNVITSIGKDGKLPIDSIKKCVWNSLDEIHNIIWHTIEPNGYLNFDERILDINIIANYYKQVADLLQVADEFYQTKLSSSLYKGLEENSSEFDKFIKTIRKSDLVGTYFGLCSIHGKITFNEVEAFKRQVQKMNKKTPVKIKPFDETTENKYDGIIQTVINKIIYRIVVCIQRIIREENMSFTDEQEQDLKNVLCDKGSFFYPIIKPTFCSII